METVSGKKIFFEIKFTENEFGKAKFDEMHKNKFNKVYKGNLGAIKEEFQFQDVFLDNYQILRNLICITQNSSVCFLYPNENKKIKLQAETAKSKFLKKELQDNYKPLSWEYLLELIENKVKNEDLKKHFKGFRDKYKIPTTITAKK